jgi:hypothetical protein
MRHVLVRLRQACPVGAVKPAVVVAAQPAFLDIAVAEVGAAMPAMPVEQAISPAEISVKDKVLAQQPHRLGAGLGHFTGAGDRPPIAPQELAHRRAGAGLGQNIPTTPGGSAVVRHHGLLSI